MTRPRRDDAEFGPEMKRLAIEFSEFRQANNLSQKLLAELIGVSRRTIQNVEASRRLPQKGTLKKFEELRETYKTEGKPTGITTAA